MPDRNWWAQQDNLPSYGNATDPSVQEALKNAKLAGRNPWFDPNRRLLNQGDLFGARMRQQALQAPPMVGVRTDDIDAARQLAAQSYGQQKQALGLMQQQAMGQGPSVAAIQGQASQETLMNKMTGANPNALRAGLMSGGMQQAGVQAAQQRGAEIGAAQQSWGGAAENLRGQSLQDYGQGLRNAQNASALNLQQQASDLDRELAYQRLGLAGYQTSLGGRGQQADIRLGDYERQQQMMMGDINRMAGVGSGLMGGIGRFGFGGSEGGGGSPRPSGPNDPNWAPGSYDWYSSGGT